MLDVVILDHIERLNRTIRDGEGKVRYIDEVPLWGGSAEDANTLWFDLKWMDSPIMLPRVDRAFVNIKNLSGADPLELNLATMRTWDAFGAQNISTYTEALTAAAGLQYYNLEENYDVMWTLGSTVGNYGLYKKPVGGAGWTKEYTDTSIGDIYRNPTDFSHMIYKDAAGNKYTLNNGTVTLDNTLPEPVGYWDYSAPSHCPNARHYITSNQGGMNNLIGFGSGSFNDITHQYGGNHGFFLIDRQGNEVKPLNKTFMRKIAALDGALYYFQLAGDYTLFLFSTSKNSGSSSKSKTVHFCLLNDVTAESDYLGTVRLDVLAGETTSDPAYIPGVADLVGNRLFIYFNHAQMGGSNTFRATSRFEFEIDIDV